MVALALILLVLVAALVVAIVVSNPQTYGLSIFGAIVPANALGIFLTGAVAMAVTILALLMLRMGLRRARGKASAAEGTGSLGDEGCVEEQPWTRVPQRLRRLRPDAGKTSTTPATSAATESGSH